ncbi:hypothetical protein NQ176_g4609 [Zarea fungicola]|uniref:Uncharacterized protein n=1 Tax=Zarea fungicola TaxID=93591 RepID=A0ACC1NF12_9HYPO|nr:hypothetical protein NQ176_g4609 [Lecanicillium fungicola]
MEHISINPPDVSEREYEKARFAVPHNILRSELIYGEGFQSPGGLAAFKETVLPELALAPGRRLLDLGAGLGGAVFHLASEYEVEVVGIDSAEVMVTIATDRQERLDPKGSTRFLCGSIFSDELKPGSFDAIYCQDTLMYEVHKARTFARCTELLKPGGRLVINDFALGRSTPEVESYADVSGMQLVALPAYEEMAASAGLVDVTARDISSETVRRLQSDLDQYLARTKKDTAIADADTRHLIERWHRKIRLIEAGGLAQALVRADKPIRQ